MVKDSVATTSVPDVDKLERILKRMVLMAFTDTEQATVPYFTKVADSRDKQNLLHMDSRLVKGQLIKSTTFKTVHAERKTCKTEARCAPRDLMPDSPEPTCKSNPPSPFTGAFDDIDEPNTSSVTKTKPNVLSFDDAFLCDTHSVHDQSNLTSEDFDCEFDNDAQDATMSSTFWTKQRVKGLKGKIATMTEEASLSAREEKISLSKEVLAKAQVIDQVGKTLAIFDKKMTVCVCANSLFFP